MPPKRQQEESDDEMDYSQLQGLMGGMGGLGNMDPDYDKKFLAELPEKVRDRVYVLQAMDAKVAAENKEHDEAVMALKRKYAKLAAPFYAKRRAVVSGDEEPKEEDIKKGFPEDHEGKVSLTEGSKDGDKDKGIPNFWLGVLTHHVIIAEMVSDRDGEALGSLVDITCDYIEPPVIGFTINFHFAENEYFEEKVLSKSFHMKEVNDEFVLEKAVGTKITWKEGKALNVNTVSKKQKNKKGQVRYKTEEQPCETFFDFFKEDCDEEENEQYHAMAETIKDKMIPFAVEYFTGEADDGEDDMEDGDEYDEMDEEDEDDEPDQAQLAAAMAAAGRGRGGAGGKKGGNQEECKQQ